MKEKMNLRELLNYIEFDCHYETNKEGVRVIKLKDAQHVNLGNIEYEEFNTIADVIDRCDIYWRDYVITPLCNCLDVNESDFIDWNALYNYAKGFYGEKEVDKYTVLYYIINPDMVVFDDETGTEKGN